MIDNSKVILIFCVVLGHLLEFNITPISNYILIVIYSFHMPLFIFFSGLLAKYDRNKIINNIVIPYVLLQIITFIFYNFFQTVQFSLTMGYTTLWYLISLFSWYVTIPFFEKFKHPIALILGSIALSLIIGYDNNANATFSIARTITFFPFFLAGYFSKKIHIEKLKKMKRNPILKILSLILLVTILFALYLFRDNINVMWMYGSYNYEALNYNPLIRFIILLLGFCWIFIFYALVTDRKMYISKIGKNTISIYLLHYFIVYAISKTKILYINGHYTVNCVILSIFLVLILSVDKLSNLFHKKYYKGEEKIK